MLSVELQLHARRSLTFAAEYNKIWRHHQAAIASALEALFDHLDKTPPAEPEELAAAFMAMAHGLALQKAMQGGEPYGKILMVFLRGYCPRRRNRRGLNCSLRAGWRGSAGWDSPPDAYAGNRGSAGVPREGVTSCCRHRSSGAFLVRVNQHREPRRFLFHQDPPENDN